MEMDWVDVALAEGLGFDCLLSLRVGVLLDKRRSHAARIFWNRPQMDIPERKNSHTVDSVLLATFLLRQLV